MVLAQMEDQYPCTTVYTQEMSLYISWQEMMFNAKWYETFNTRADVSNTVVITWEHKAILDYVAHEAHKW
jgi:hypothetical protein